MTTRERSAMLALVRALSAILDDDDNAIAADAAAMPTQLRRGAIRAVDRGNAALAGERR